MGKIRVMSDHLSNMIAAGEVVDRPMNIVKECAENSLDAGASSVEIEVFEGGISGIIITDNGEGMDAGDALLAFSRHATSKLKSEEELFRIQTMGFRGEALASIGAVAEVDLQTNDGKNGTHIRFEYGECTLQEQTSCPRGTRIEVRGLFTRTPARLKYLKKANYEFSVIADAVNKLAVSHPDIRFVLRHDGRLIFQTSGKGSKAEVLYQMYGREVAENALPFQAEGYDFEISGLAVQPKISRASRNFIYITVNDRVVKSWPITSAVLEGYREFLPKERYPIFFINVKTDPQLVDVNVHPNKLEVRLSKEDFLSQLIINTIENLFSDGLETLKVEALREAPAVQEELELDFSRKKNEAARNDIEMVRMMNPNQETHQDLMGNPHIDDFRENNRQVQRDWQKEYQPSEQSMKKEIREQFSGQIPAGIFSRPAKGKQSSSDSGSGYSKPQDEAGAKPAAHPMDRFRSEDSLLDLAQKQAEIADSESFAPFTSLDLPASENPEDLSGAEASGSFPGTDVDPFDFYSRTESSVVAANPEETGLESSESDAIRMERERGAEGKDLQQPAPSKKGSRGKEFFDHLHVIGQLKDSYILCENPQGLVIIDQHAAQERYNFERLKKQFEQPVVSLQPRMVPMLIPVTTDQFVMLDTINSYTEKYGLIFEAFGNGKFILRQEPVWMQNLDRENFVHDLLAMFQQSRKVDVEELQRHMVATAACHSSIRFNRPLSRAEMEKVIYDLQECEHPYHCPHGRPTVLTLSDLELRKDFERG